MERQPKEVKFNFKFPENNEETEIVTFGTVSLHHLCFNTVPGFLFASVQIVGFSYLLRLPGLRDCTGPHSSLPALGTAEGVLHTHTHNIHTSRFKGLKSCLCEGKNREDETLPLIVRKTSLNYLFGSSFFFFLIGGFILQVYTWGG